MEQRYLRAIHPYGYRWGKENAKITEFFWDDIQNRAAIRLLFESDSTEDYVPVESIYSGDFMITPSKDPWPATD